MNEQYIGGVVVAIVLLITLFAFSFLKGDEHE